jgi:Flp pilus assembly protein TadD
MQLGVLKARLDDCLGATQAFEQVLELRPDDSQILNNLAYLAVDCGSDLGLAITRAQKAVAAKPASAEFRDTLGVILLAQAKEIADSDPEARDLAVRKAEQELKQATRLSQSVSPWIHLSELYLFLNRPDEARRAVAKASDLDEEERFQDKFDALLEQIKDR